MPAAVITGACSGIGLALTTHLYEKGWKIFMADVAEGTALAERLHTDASKPAPTFVKADVSVFSDQARLFKLAFAQGEVALFAANAGIDDRDDFFGALAVQDGEPVKPSTGTVDVNLNGVVEGIRLFLHFRAASAAPSSDAHIVITASMAAQYPFPTNPIYAATKHALLGLTRSVGGRLAERGVYVNAIMPAFVPTNLAPPGLIDLVAAKGHITPMATVIRAYDELVAQKQGGRAVECSLDQLYYREHVEFANESQRVLIEDPEGWWSGAYGRVRE